MYTTPGQLCFKSPHHSPGGFLSKFTFQHTHFPNCATLGRHLVWVRIPQRHRAGTGRRYDKDTRRTIASRVRWSSRLFARSSCHRGAVVEQLLSDAPAAEVAAAPAWPKFRGKRLKCAASHGESPVEVRGRARKLIALRHVAALRVDRAQPRVKPGVQALLLGRESKCCCCGEG